VKSRAKTAGKKSAAKTSSTRKKARSKK
jgi:hypothetical protein